jgi:signal transduction histidine kinase
MMREDRKEHPLVLVVDDDETIRSMVRESLEVIGLTVKEAENGEQALYAFEQSKPDLVLLDILLPDMDGFTTYARIRQLLNGENIPVVILTGINDFETITRAYEIGVTDFIIKPINLLLLRYRVLYILRASQAIDELRKSKDRLEQAQKLESIGQLAAGIAHEINTPIQYIGDNTRFLQDSFHDLIRLFEKYRELLEASKKGEAKEYLISDVEAMTDDIDIEYLTEEIPQAVHQSLEGVERVARIVQAMKEFAHPGAEDKTFIDINKAIESTIIVARNEWKYVAEMITDFDSSLPLVPCLPGDFNQVILNMIVNASHAIADVNGSGNKGIIKVCTSHSNDCAEIRISDTGTGIPDAAISKIFNPFFTTKEVGKGTGQGLAISYDVIVKKHGGSITFDTKIGKGTTFIIRLPINDKGNQQSHSTT